jgi:hypothetical protein
MMIYLADGDLSSKMSKAVPILHREKMLNVASCCINNAGMALSSAVDLAGAKVCM